MKPDQCTSAVCGFIHASAVGTPTVVLSDASYNALSDRLRVPA